MCQAFPKPLGPQTLSRSPAEVMSESPSKFGWADCRVFLEQEDKATTCPLAPAPVAQGWDGRPGAGHYPREQLPYLLL